MKWIYKKISFGIIWIFVCMWFFYVFTNVSKHGDWTIIPTGKDKNTFKWPKYVKIVESIDPKYYTNTSFLSCFNEKVASCVKNNLKQTLALSGSFLENINSLSKISWNEPLDNCVGDILTSCYDGAIHENISKEWNINECNWYNDEVLKKNCFNEMYPKIAISKDDISICNGNTEVYWLKYCQDSFNQNKAVKSKDINYCDKLSEDFNKKLCRDNYYFSVALDINDISFCKTAGDKTAISNCALNYATQSMMNWKIEDCEKIKNYWEYLWEQELKSLYERCIIEKVNTAMQQGDIKNNQWKYFQWCTQLQDNIMKQDCLMKIWIPQIDINKMTQTGTWKSFSWNLSSSSLGNVMTSNSGSALSPSDK